MSKAGDMSMMAYMPLQAHWLAQLAAYQSTDAQLVRASLAMLQAAWHQVPAGQLDASVDTLAAVTGLAPAAVTASYKTLVAGWQRHRVKGEDYITFAPMAELAGKLHEGYGHALARLQQAAFVAIAAPDLFGSELLPEQGQTLASQVGESTSAPALAASTNVARKLPDGAQITPASRQTLADRGFYPERVEEIWQRFCDYFISRGERSLNWERQFRYWLENQIRYGSLTPDDANPKVVVRPAESGAQRPARAVPARFVPAAQATERGQQTQRAAQDNLDRAAAMLTRRRTPAPAGTTSGVVPPPPRPAQGA